MRRKGRSSCVRGLQSISREFEPLEARCLLAARVVITEVVASNEQGLEDTDGDREDWIELFNAGDQAAGLSGWSLTDDVAEPAKWTFPDVTLQPQSYLVVFASGKDRQDADGSLHTSFRLSADGEYLGLYRPDETIAEAEFSPQFPPMLADRSFGLPQGNESVTLADFTAGVRWLVPSAENGGSLLDDAWRAVDFDDSGWSQGAGGVGYGAVFDDLVGVRVQDQMQSKNGSVWMRIPFTLERPDELFAASFRLQYNDGYVAYLNGIEIARGNAPDRLSWNSLATASRTPNDSRQIEELNISARRDLLRAGENVLAIHGLNRSLTSGDLLFVGGLQGTRPVAIVDEQARYFDRPSPGAPNGLVSYAGLTARPQVSVQHGLFAEPFSVELSSETPGATLVYTTDGSTPSLSNGVTVTPGDNQDLAQTSLQVSQTTALRVAAFKEDTLASSAVTQTYLFLADVITQDVERTHSAGFPETWKRADPDYGMDPEVIGPNDLFGGVYANQIVAALAAAPTVSIVTDLEHLFDFDTGIYMNSTLSGAAWERPTSVELIHPDGADGFQLDAGLRIQGDNVRNLAGSRKQSLRLEFREEYGAKKLRYPIFGQDAAEQFDSLILRGLYNDRWVSPDSQYIRDQWARETLIEMGRPNANGIFVHVYLNGIYWGLYNLIERPEAAFSASYFGGNKDDWDALNSGSVRSGNDDAWSMLRTESRKVKNADLQQSNTAYLRLLGRDPQGARDPQAEVLLDVDNYIDYLIMNFYGGNNDWPQKNYYIGRQRGTESTGFKFYAWDTEKILDHGTETGLSANQTNASSGVAEMYVSLRTNAEFRLAFADRVQQHFFNGGVLYVDPEHSAWDPAHPEWNRPAARYAEIAAQAELPLIGESARWGDSSAGRPYVLADWQAQRDDMFRNYFPQRSSIALDQFVQAGLFPAVAAPVFSQHGGEIAPGFQLSIEAAGEVYYTLDGSDPRQNEWEPDRTATGISPNASHYVGPITLGTGATVQARTLIDGQWSALNVATFDAGLIPLRVAEVMYNPPELNPGQLVDPDDYEFIELVNVSSSQTIDLQGVAFTQGIEHEFDATSLAPNERAVVVKNLDAFRERYGEQVRVLGEYGPAFGLDNGGELIRLQDAQGRVIHEFLFDDDWVVSTDGDGYSLTIQQAQGSLDNWNVEQGWRGSYSLGGSPGRDDAADFDGDGRTSSADMDLYCVGQRVNDLQFDLTRDGVVDEHDLSWLVEGILHTSFGDADLDGRFTLEDLNRFVASGEYEDDLPGNSTWSEGDWNCDGDFSSPDVVLAFSAASLLTTPAASATSRSDLAAVVDDLAARNTTRSRSRRDV